MLALLERRLHLQVGGGESIRASVNSSRNFSAWRS
jgi:hypothetical protein